MFYLQTFASFVSCTQNVLVQVVYPSSSFHAQVRGLVSGSPSELTPASSCPDASLRVPPRAWCAAVTHQRLSPFSHTGHHRCWVCVSRAQPEAPRPPRPCFLAPYLNSRSLSPQMSRAWAGPSSGVWDARQFRRAARSVLPWAGLGVRKRSWEAQAGGGRRRLSPRERGGGRLCLGHP